MAKKFNLAEYVKDDMSKMDTGMEQITLLPLEKLIPDERNFYSLDGIDELAANIETVGLLDPIRVRPQDGEYIIVSGHRRRAACMLLRDGGNPMFDRGVPCIIELGEASDAMRELRLIFANSATRQLTSAELSKQAERTNAVLLQLKKEGFEFKGKTRELVAEILHVSESKVARVSAIRKNLIPLFLEKYDSGLIGESVAYRLSQEPAELQQEVWASVGISIHGCTAESVDMIIDQVKKRREAPQDPRAVEDAGPYRDKFDAEAYIAQRREEDDYYSDMMCAVMDRIIDRLPLIDNRQDGIAALKKEFRWSSTGGDTVNYEGRGNGLELESRRRGIEPILRSWTEAFDVLCVEAINRLGKMNANKRPAVESGGPSRTPAPTWQTGTPETEGWYACWAQWVDKYKGALPAYDPDYETLWWNGSMWTNGYNSTNDAGFAVHFWYPLPPEPDAEEV